MPSTCSVITLYTRSSSEGLETKVLGVQSEGLPTESSSRTPATSASKSPRPAARERAEFGHRGGLLVLAQLAPLRVVPCLACELRYQDQVGLRAHTDHVFCYRGRSPGLATRAAPPPWRWPCPIQKGHHWPAFRKAHHPGVGAWARSGSMTLMAIVTPNRDLGRLARGDARWLRSRHGRVLVDCRRPDRSRVVPIWRGAGAWTRWRSSVGILRSRRGEALKLSGGLVLLAIGGR